MTEHEFQRLKERVRTQCPRGLGYFCDGTPNLSVKSKTKRGNIGKCEYRKQGGCTALKSNPKEQQEVV